MGASEVRARMQPAVQLPRHVTAQQGWQTAHCGLRAPAATSGHHAPSQSAMVQRTMPSPCLLLSHHCFVLDNLNVSTATVQHAVQQLEV